MENINLEPEVIDVDMSAELEWCVINNEEFYIQGKNLVKYVNDSEICTTEPDVVIPDGIEIINDMAFYRCDPITVKIPDSVRIIGKGAFASCPWLKNINIPKNLEYIADDAFKGSYHIELSEDLMNDNFKIEYEDGLKLVKINGEDKLVQANASETELEKLSENGFYIEDSVLIRYTGTKSVVSVPDGIVKIGKRAFAFCENLVEVEIPLGVVEIGAGAFLNCINLERVKIPQSILIIRNCAFAWCANLKSILLPENLKHIGAFAFLHCNSILDVLIPNGVKILGNGIFIGCKELHKVKLPDGLEVIAESMFNSCYKLTEITIPNGIRIIEKEAFFNCNNLKELILPESIKEIGERAFYNCYELTELEFNNGIETLGDEAFEWCGGLNMVRFPCDKIIEEFFQRAAPSHYIDFVCGEYYYVSFGMDDYSDEEEYI